MLTIRKEQMEAFSAAMSRRFEQRMLEHIRDIFADRTKPVSDEKIRIFIQDSITRAERYTIEYEDDIRRFIEYLVIYGTQFDTKPETRWAGEILQRTDLSGTAKMDMIDDYEMEIVRGTCD